jgi:fructose-specific phosphotransferase system IIC component
MMKTMFRNSLPAVVSVLVLLFVSGCVSVGGVFQSGFWVGIVLAVIAVVLVIWLVSKMRGGGGSSTDSQV